MTVATAPGPAAGGRDEPRGGDELPGPVAGGRDELLRVSGRSRLRRVWLPGDAGTVLLKEPLGAGALARARHENMILERLRGIPGIGGLAGITVADTVVLHDIRGERVEAVLRDGKLSPAQVLTIARDLAATIAAMHTRGVVHLDINPANVLLTGPDRHPILIDFGAATSLADDDSGFVHHRDIVGTLAYLSPEQTGRTGRPIDHRTDLYALGATLHEMVAGAPPFLPGDDLRLIRDILLSTPEPLTTLLPGCPPALSQIVTRLLSKEPDERYQSAQGLLRDLNRAADRPRETFELGRWDFPFPLSAPARLIGRDREITALHAAFTRAMLGNRRGLLITGVPGVGKTALINELRRPLTARGGWFVSGKASQYQEAATTGPVQQALGGLAPLLLAEPPDVLLGVQHRLRDALGPHAGLVAAALPPFAPLLGDTDTTTEVGTGSRLPRALVELTRAIASAQRPVVLVIDDLHWADPVSLTLLDALITEPDLPGLMIIGAFRADWADTGHPLTALVTRWRSLGVMPATIPLENLPADRTTTMLADLLRLPAAAAERLGTCLLRHTAGNPFDTLELLNALRRDDLLHLGDDGWTWDETAIRDYVARGDVLDLLQDRLAHLPPATRSLLHTMAYLGSAVPAGLLAVAADLPLPELVQQLGPALDDGLLLWQHTDLDDHGQLLRFRHDRVHQAAFDTGDIPGRAGHRLALARRLAQDATCTVPAAEQYLAAGADLPVDEQHRVRSYYRTAAEHALTAGNHATANRFLTAAADLLDGEDLTEVRVRRHAVRYSLGLLGAADADYAAIEDAITDPIDLAGPACIQIGSLTQRNRHRAALDLGLALLRRLGQTTPDPAEPVPAGRVAELTRWAGELNLSRDLARPEADRPVVLATARLFNRLSPTAYFLQEQALVAWFVLQGQRMWVHEGPCAELAALLGVISPMVTPALGDLALSQAVGDHMLAFCSARGFDPLTAMLRHRQSLHVMPWTGPLERSIEQAALARTALLRGDDPQMAGHAALTLLAAQLECGRTLDTYAEEIATTEAFTTRNGHTQIQPVVAAHHHLLRTLLGTREETPPGDEVLPVREAGPFAAGIDHTYRALAAALTGDTEALHVHAAEAYRLRAAVSGYATALIRLLRALSLTEQRRDTGEPDGDAEIERCRDHLRSCAATAPGNFAHLAALVDAEYAWARGDFRAALTAYDQCRKLAALQQRPWHQALAAERLGRFQLTQALPDAAQRTLLQARQAWAAWGATGRTAQLDDEFPALRGTATSQGGTTVTSALRADTIDTLALLRASQAISSETNLERLHHSIIDQLAGLTGATDVVVTIHDQDTGDWYVPPSEHTGGRPLGVVEAANRGLLPIGVFRYVERTAEPVLVDDVTRDDRFLRDPCFAGLDRCSLLAVPALHHGAVNAILILTRSHSSAAFTADRLDAVKMITGQLVISIENARLYASLEAKVAARTTELEAANRSLEQLSTTDALTGVANRRGFDRALDRETRFTLVLLDVDHFKLFNDAYGHPAGDDCLARVAATLAGNVRDSDLVFRYGGEEFALLLADTPPAEALRVAERVRAAVEALRIPHERGLGGVVTVSAGVAAHDGDISPSLLLSRADTALYEAKGAGRNRVRSYAAQDRPL
ncbi:diguanylate cyclase [Winogradskya humida]|uniref:Diguanylate cyclase (GGDEF)-like protein n=1 Tax=Winogradskya humida TaxID=113566 RepID=A0ABQ3ZY57_9ACTN|nr:diguanylate cyclase [Actinoplanes humidus]GIE23478.1 hypothetical protein Ahu01nite_065800 [Actinoplanes humidus]